MANFALPCTILFIILMSSFYSGYGSRSYIGEMNTSPNEKTWCVAKAGTSDDVLQSNIDFACSQPQVDCGPIQSGAPCFLPDDQINHASYAMNSYFQNYGKTPETCDFSGSGIIVTLDPSYGSRSYVGEMDTLPNEKTWCVAKNGTSGDVLQSNLDFACSQAQVDCGPIQSGAPCFLPDDLINHASYAMNSYFQNYGKTPESCDFRGSGVIVTLDPSQYGCDGWLWYGGDGMRFDGRLGDGVPF
ncbi:hypothetical protein ACOSQ2_011932 [Xanthoceras sorbifolium]